MSVKAIELWTKIVEAMRADGLLAHCVTQSGPNTTKVLLEAVATPPWLPAEQRPVAGERVLAEGSDGSWTIAYWDARFDGYRSDADGLEYSVVRWRFLQ